MDQIGRIILAPVLRVMRGLRLSSKLALIGGVTFVALTALAGQLLAGRFAERAFTQSEETGARIVAQTMELLAQLNALRIDRAHVTEILSESLVEPCRTD